MRLSWPRWDRSRIKLLGTDVVILNGDSLRIDVETATVVSTKLNVSALAFFGGEFVS